MSRRRTGFTLLEVVVGLMLMGSLVASALVALASHQHALLLAQRKQAALQVAQNLLSGWYDLRGNVPTRDQGALVIDRPWLWRTQKVSTRIVCGLPVHVIRLDVLGTVDERGPPQILASIELIQRTDVGEL